MILLIIRNKYSLTEQFIKTYNVVYKSVFTKVALENDSISIVFLLKMSYPQNFTMYEKEYISSLIVSFKRSNMGWLTKIYLLKSMLDFTTYIKVEDLCLYMLRQLEKENPADNPMYYAPNVLLFTCNLIELCRNIAKKYNFLGAFTKKIENIITKVTAIYIENINDEFELRALVFEKDYENRDSLDLLSMYNISEIMDNKNMEKIALELWTSQYDVKGSFMTTSSAYKIFTYDSFNRPRDILTDFLFLNWRFRSLDNFEHHLYQFQVWKKSMRAKFLVEGIFLTILTVIFQFYLMEATTAANTVDELFSSFSGAVDPMTGALIFQTFETEAVNYYENMQITIYLSYIALCFPIRIILVMAFALKSERRFNPFTVSNLLDLAICSVFLTRLYYEYDYYRNDVSEQTTEILRGIQYYDNIFRYREDGQMLDYLYSVGAACLWLRILLLFRLTRFLGPLVKMIQNMMTDIGIFMILFSTQLIIFGSIGTLLFASTDGYSSFYEALLTLFASALGGFDFSALDGSNKNRYIRDAFLVVFLILNLVLMLNLLIAILSSTYAQLEDKKLVLYINEILKLRSTLEYDKRCSSLVSTFPPWNVITLLFMPFLLFFRKPVKLNSILFHIEYLPMLLLLFTAYLTMNAIIMPFAYLKGIFVCLQLVFKRNMETSISFRLMKLLVFTVLGIPILMANLCADIIVFF